MKSKERIIAWLLACSVCASSGGCTSMKTINPVTQPGAPAFGRIKAGDVVVVQTRDGRRERLVVRQIDGETIVSEDGQRYTHDDITRLQRRSFSGPKTALLVGGIMVAWIAAATAAAYGALLGGAQ